MNVGIHHVQQTTSKITMYTNPHVFYCRTICVHVGGSVNEIEIYAPTQEALLFKGETPEQFQHTPADDPDEIDQDHYTEHGSPVGRGSKLSPAS